MNKIPDNHTEIDDLIAEYEKDPDKRKSIAEARKKVHHTVEELLEEHKRWRK